MMRWTRSGGAAGAREGFDRSCMGQNCDHWLDLYEHLESCAWLEANYGCDCNGCDCRGTGPFER